MRVYFLNIIEYFEKTNYVTILMYLVIRNYNIK